MAQNVCRIWSHVETKVPLNSFEFLYALGLSQAKSLRTEALLSPGFEDRRMQVHTTKLCSVMASEERCSTAFGSDRN